MERYEETFLVDTIKHYNTEWETELLRDGVNVLNQPVYTDAVDIGGSVEIEFDEYFTYIRGEMEVTVSWVEREYKGEPYEEDHRLESVEVLE